MDRWNREHFEEVLNGLNGMRERSELTDVVLEVEGRSFPCHRALLASCSPYFRTMFTSGYSETKQASITIRDVSEPAMATILDYAYTGCLKMEPDQVQAVMSAGRLLQMDFVWKEAAEYMKDHLDVPNCADVLMYADMMADITLQEASRRYMASRFSEVVVQPSFLQLSLSQLQLFLDRDDLITHSEDHVVQAALRWVEFDQEDRIQHLHALCKSFRRSFLSSKTCNELESKYQSRKHKLVYSNSKIQRLGQMRKETLIFFKDSFRYSDRCAPCFDPLRDKVNSMSLPKNLHGFSVAVTPQDDLYMAGGVNEPEFFASKTKIETQKVFFKYNHLLNTWEPRCEMTTPRVSCGLVCLGDFIYAIGGDKTKKTVEQYNPSCDTWKSVAPVPRRLSSDFCTISLDNNIYVISEAGNYCYNETENTWSDISDMLSHPELPQATTFQGCIYCVDKKGQSTYVEKYDSKNRVWKCSGKHISLPRCESTILTVYGGCLYLLALLIEHDYDQLWPNSQRHRKIFLYQYRPRKKSWLKLKTKTKPEASGMSVDPIVDFWFEKKCRTECLVARMIPTCLGDQDTYYDTLADDDYEEDSDESPSGGSSDDGDSGSHGDLTNQDDSDVEDVTDEEESESDSDGT